MGVRGFDSKQNKASAGDFIFTVDNTKPNVDVVEPANGALKNSSFTVSGTASDSSTDIEKVLYTVTKVSGIGGSYVANITSGTAIYNDVAGTFSFDLSGLSTGFYRLKAQAFDNAGNWKYDYNDVEVDTTAPVATITNPTDGETIHGVVTVSGDVVDDNPLNSYFRIEGPSSYVKTSLYTDGRLHHEFSWDTTTVADGTYTIYFETRDKAGNKDGTRSAPADSVKKITVIVDNTAPTNLTAGFTEDSSGDAIPDNGYTNEEYFTFNLNADGSPTRFQLKYWNDIPGSSFKIGTPWNPTNLSSLYPGHFTQGEGTHFFSFSACDAASNCSPYGAPFTVTFDRTAPAVNAGPDQTKTDTLSATLGGSYTDNSPATVAWTGPAGVSFGDSSALNSSVTVPSYGVYTLTLTVTDAAGNFDSDTVKLTFNQTPTPTNPSFSTPAANNSQAPINLPSQSQGNRGITTPIASWIAIKTEMYWAPQRMTPIQAAQIPTNQLQKIPLLRLITMRLSFRGGGW